MKAVRRRKRRSEAVDAAAAVFAARGYDGASTTEIAARLGIRQGSLYYYFRSKDAALYEVCQIGVAGFVQAAASILAARGGAADKLRRTVHAHMGPFETRSDYVRVFLRERHLLPARPRRRIGRLSREYEQLVERVLRGGVESGEFRAGLEPRLAALAVIGMCNAAAAWYRPERHGPVAPLAEAFADLVLRGCR